MRLTQVLQFLQKNHCKVENVLQVILPHKLFFKSLLVVELLPKNCGNPIKCTGNTNVVIFILIFLPYFIKTLISLEIFKQFISWQTQVYYQFKTILIIF